MKIKSERRPFELGESTMVEYQLKELKAKYDTADEMTRDWYRLRPTLLRRFFVAGERPVEQCARVFVALTDLPEHTKAALRDALASLPQTEDKRAVARALQEFGSLEGLNESTHRTFHAVVSALGENGEVYWDAVARWLHLLAWMEDARVRIESLSTEALTPESWRIEYSPSEY